MVSLETAAGMLQEAAAIREALARAAVTTGAGG
jgi:hypothetical protein